MTELEGRRILLIVSGGIAACKAPELVRELVRRGAQVRCLPTRGAKQFVTPLTLQTLSGQAVADELFDLTTEHEIGHIQLSREAELIVVAPVTAHLLARMAHGLADDLASTVLLATDTPVLVAPAMNVRMWTHPATQANLATLAQRGVRVVGPAEGEMACGEYGPGRLAEVPDIVAAIQAALTPADQRLRGRRAIVTSGPTREPLDPVRFLSNQSSGRQGHAIAAALAELGAAVTLVTGPVTLADPPGVDTRHVETAEEMLAACRAALPADIAVCAAAVSDWRAAAPAPGKLKKDADATPPRLELVANPDILATLAGLPADRRPALVVGFAAETDHLLEHARAKLARKGCDWIIANQVGPGTDTFGGPDNTVHLIDAADMESWPTAAKTEIARRLARRIADHLETR
ncbi:bifunctional phosphopantothenoylcysteine decarboxylase/phosphopantothenate--cysteine ligase CoaBC [Roseospirillum parvum]|uniref:Coenzyme A biosynthesis bifunctional protein CoaBC n=1 Tax=Roseospirillum parvum TaxID=83401 RepID=A0A1G8FYF7_9PROT|nr:bifunctional phosphopantothenoylcysteine decarboxylase/phosphopantothenate--cysteine ligase CoaBC [Roseospirillum parvum]SDH87181.1 phosphopantothenoylcysteine decarboxylase / phosphopantothenate--cysteine ligase [Roseospirillum parvum]